MFKNVKITLIVGLSVMFECNGHLGILKDIVGGAHEHIHATVDKVAGGILGGLNINFQGHIGHGGQRYPNRPAPPPPSPPAGGQQTVVVIVEEIDDNNQHGVAPNYYGQNGNNNYPNRPGYNNNHQGQWNGDRNQNNPYGNQNYGQNQYGNQNGNYGRPNQYPQQGQNNYQQRPNQNNGNYGNGRPDQNNQDDYNDQRPEQENPNSSGNHNSNNQKPEQENPNSGNHNGGSYNNNGGNNNLGQQTTPKQEETRPTFGTVHEEPTQKPITEKSTEKDEPLFVPLNPNQYHFEGDKESSNSPKRETDIEKNTEDKDEDFPIDIRFQDQ